MAYQSVNVSNLQNNNENQQTMDSLNLSTLNVNFTEDVIDNTKPNVNVNKIEPITNTNVANDFNGVNTSVNAVSNQIQNNGYGQQNQINANVPQNNMSQMQYNNPNQQYINYNSYNNVPTQQNNNMMNQPYNYNRQVQQNNNMTNQSYNFNQNVNQNTNIMSQPYNYNSQMQQNSSMMNNAYNFNQNLNQNNNVMNQPYNYNNRASENNNIINQVDNIKQENIGINDLVNQNNQGFMPQNNIIEPIVEKNDLVNNEVLTKEPANDNYESPFDILGDTGAIIQSGNNNNSVIDPLNDKLVPDNNIFELTDTETSKVNNMVSNLLGDTESTTDTVPVVAEEIQKPEENLDLVNEEENNIDVEQLNNIPDTNLTSHITDVSPGFKRCPKCGQKMREDYKQCFVCGTYF